LFCIYVNDIPSALKNCSCILYADDLILYTSADSIGDLRLKIQKDIINLKGWCKVNGMLISQEKTKCMYFTHERNHSNNDNRLDLKIDCAAIQQVDKFKYLGVWLDENLTYKYHSDVTISKFVQRVRLLKQHKNGFNFTQLKTFCDALCLSIPYYCLHIWTLASETYMHKCDRIMHKMMKTILCLKAERRLAFHDLLEKFGWLTTGEKRTYQILKFVYKHTKEESSLYNVFSDVLVFVNHKNDRSQRKPHNLVTPRFNTTVGQQCFIYNAVRLWNDLPSDIQQTDIPSKFDSSVIDWLLTKRLSDFGI